MPLPIGQSRVALAESGMRESNPPEPEWGSGAFPIGQFRATHRARRGARIQSVPSGSPEFRQYKAHPDRISRKTGENSGNHERSEQALPPVGIEPTKPA